MKSEVYWIEKFTKGRLGTMARPRGGDWLEDEIIGWKNSGIRIVVSALTDEEMNELDIVNEAVCCRAHGIDFFRFPVKDRGLPASLLEWSRFINLVKARFDSGSSLVTHCRMGIGRASMIVVSLMVACGIDVEDALLWTEQARGCPVPDTTEQREWIVKFARSSCGDDAP